MRNIIENRYVGELKQWASEFSSSIRILKVFFPLSKSTMDVDRHKFVVRIHVH